MWQCNNLTYPSVNGYLAQFSVYAMHTLFLCISWITSLGHIPRHGIIGSKATYMLVFDISHKLPYRKMNYSYASTSRT